MGIRIQSDETYDSWSSRVQIHELSIAKQQIANGAPVDQVLERMSTNITKKMLHPLLKAIDNIPVDLDALAASRKAYEDNYINKVGRAADHVDD